jgi:hypothetical protein
MSKAHGGGATVNGRARLFSASDRKRILALVVGEPSGVKVTVGGMEFNMVAVSSEELMSVLDLVIKFSDMFDKIGVEGALKESDVFRAIGEDGARIMGLVKSMLYRSAALDDDDTPDEDRALFDEWFNKLPIMETIKTLTPAVLEANGIGNVRPPKTTENGTPTPTPSTPANTSSLDTPGPTPTASSDA